MTGHLVLKLGGARHIQCNLSDRGSCQILVYLKKSTAGCSLVTLDTGLGLGSPFIGFSHSISSFNCVCAQSAHNQVNWLSRGHKVKEDSQIWLLPVSTLTSENKTIHFDGNLFQ